MIIKLVSNNSYTLNTAEVRLCHALLRFMEASKEIMHDDIRHKQLLQAFEGAAKTFEKTGFDVIITDGVEND